MKTIRDKYRGMTFAQAAKKIADKYKDRQFDSLQDKAYQEEIKLLMQMQEEITAKESAQEYAIGQLLSENSEVIEVEGQQQPQQPMMKEGGQFPDRYKKMGFSGVNKPKRTPGASKSHAVVVKDGGNYKLIRFGQQGVSGAGKNPKSDKEKARRKSFKARHAKNIAKGKTSAAYWANKVKWAEGGWIKEATDKMKEKGTEGAFTKAANKADMGVQEYANKVLKDPNATTLQKQRANFAKNMKGISKKKKKMALGDYLDPGKGKNPLLDWLKSNDPAFATFNPNSNTTSGLGPLRNMNSSFDLSNAPGNYFVGRGYKQYPTLTNILGQQRPATSTSTSTSTGGGNNDFVFDEQEMDNAVLQSLVQDRNKEDERLRSIEQLQSLSPEAKSQADLLKRNTPKQEQTGVGAENTSGYDDVSGGEGDSAYDAALRGERINKLINAGILLGGPERRSPVFNPYEGDIMNKVNAMGVNLDPVRQGIQASANAAINRISNMSRSASNMKSNIQNIYANMNTGIANAEMQQQQQLNQIRQSQASILNNLGVNRQQAITTAKEINDRNRGVFQSELSKFGASIMDQGKFKTRMEVQKGQNLLMAKILSDSFADFNINPDLMAKLSEGRYDELSQQELITLNKQLPEDKFKTFAQVYQSKTGKKLEVDKKKSEPVKESGQQQVEENTVPDTNPLSSTTQVTPVTDRQSAISAVAGNQQPAQQSNTQSSTQNDMNPAKDMDEAIDQILDFEASKGSAQGTGLPNYGNGYLQNPTKEEAKQFIEEKIVPLVENIGGTVEEKRSLIDHWYNTGTDARIYAYQEYLKRTDPNNTKGWKDANGNWKDRNKFRQATNGKGGNYGWTDSSLEQEMTNLYNSIPANQRREILKTGRDWYYKNLKRTDNAYENSWQYRVQETGD